MLTVLKSVFQVVVKLLNSVFHQIRQAKFAYGGSILSLSQFMLQKWSKLTQK